MLVLLLLAACDTGSGTTAAPSTGPSAAASAAGSAPAATRPADPALAACPDRVPAADDLPQVPAPPTTQTEGRLVPDADPVEALLCRYGPLGPDGAESSGAVLLTDGLDRVRFDLDVPAGTPSRCPAPATRLPHLLRLTYADGELWLAALAGCDGASNGAFDTAARVGDRLTTAYASRAWPGAGATTG